MEPVSDEMFAYGSATRGASDSWTPPRKRRKGGRLYSGCGTCRMRKIKCDLGRPICWNCKRSRKYTCDGFTGGLDSPAAGPLTEICQDAIEPNHGRQTTSSPQSSNLDWLGQVLGDSTAAYQSGSDNDLVNEMATGTRPTILNTEIDFPVAFPAGRNEDNHLTAITEQRIFDSSARQDAPLPAGLHTLIETQGELDLHSSLPEPFSDEVSSSPWRIRHETISIAANPMRNRELGNGQQLEATSLPSRMTNTPNVLLHHWQTHTCHLMMPTLAPTRNPWLHLYYPLAVTAPLSSAKACLLHAILSAAAFHKAATACEDKCVLVYQANGYKREAATRLKTIVDGLQRSRKCVEDPMDRKALLAAAMSIATVEVFSGEHEGTGYEHLLIGRQVIEYTGGLSWWTSNADSMTLLQIFKCLQIIGRTSGWPRFMEPTTVIGCARQPRKDYPNHHLLNDFEENLGQIGNNEQHEAPWLPSEYPLDVTFGVSSQTLQCLSKIIDLSRVKAGLLTGEQWPRSSLEQLATLESELFSILDESVGFDENYFLGSGDHNGISGYVCQEIKENHMLAFRYSTAIFFRRALCDGGSTINPPIERHNIVANGSNLSGQSLVDKALEHLENIDTMSSCITVANTLWVAFIAAVEAIDIPLRHRALVWFARAKRHRIGNIAKAKALVLEVWRRVDRQAWGRTQTTRELGSIDWRHVMQEKAMYLMLT